MNKTPTQEFVEWRQSEYDRARHFATIEQGIRDRINENMRKLRREKALAKAARRIEEEGIDYD